MLFEYLYRRLPVQASDQRRVPKEIAHGAALLWQKRLDRLARYLKGLTP